MRFETLRNLVYRLDSFVLITVAALAFKPLSEGDGDCLCLVLGGQRSASSSASRQVSSFFMFRLMGHLRVDDLLCVYPTLDVG